MMKLLKSYVALVAPAYWLLLALLYNGPYWNAFGIKVLEYASFADLVKMAVIPVITSLAGGVFGTLLGTFPYYIEKKRNRLKAWLAIALILLVGTLLGTVASLFLAVLIGVSAFFRSDKSFEDLLRDVNVWYTASIFLLAIVPLGAYFKGLANAKSVTSESNYSYILEDGRELRYIGLVGEHFFLLSESGTTLVRHKNSLLSFELHQPPREFDTRPYLFRWLDPLEVNDTIQDESIDSMQEDDSSTQTD